MNDNDQILAELRKISAWADKQRKMTKWSLIFVAVFIPLWILFGVAMERRSKRSIGDIQAPVKQTWYDVDRNINRSNLAEAIRIGEELIQKTPQYHQGHHLLACAYLTEGKVAKARDHYAEAFRLFPSEDNEKLLIAIDKRIKEER